MKLMLTIKLLYDLDTERDQITLIQSLLLMTYWFERPDNPKNTAQWLSLAISLGHGIGLHRNPYKASEPEGQRLRKRVWWCSFMRDKLVALATSRPAKIGLKDGDVPMLTVDDFESWNFPRDLSCVQGCTYLHDQRTQRELALSCVEMVKLCICIGHVLNAHNSLANNAQGCATPKVNVRTKMMLLAPSPGPDMSEVRRCDEELVKWAAELPDDILYRRPVSNDFDKSLTVHKARLLMLYFAATLCVLHRTIALQSGPLLDNNRAIELREVSAKKARLAASEISRICKDLIEFDLVRYLPTSGVTSVLLASIIHLEDLMAEDADVRNSALGEFTRCVTCMQNLRDMYFSADYAVHLLEASVRKMNIKGTGRIAHIPSLSSHRRAQAIGHPEPVHDSIQAHTEPSGFPSLPNMDEASSMPPEEDIARHLENMFALIPTDPMYQNDGSLETNPSSYFLPSFGDMTTGCYPYNSNTLFMSGDNFMSPTSLDTAMNPFPW
jgi:hypothetical protein